MDHPLFHRTAEKHCGEWINLPMPLSTNDRCGSRGNCEGVDTSSSSFCHNPCKVELLGGFLTGKKKIYIYILFPILAHFGNPSETLLTKQYDQMGQRCFSLW